MTNYEKYKDQIDWQARAGAKLAVKKNNNTPTTCDKTSCRDCEFCESKSCVSQAIEWLKAEYVEPEIEVGDEVVVIDKDHSCSTYADWVVNNVSNICDGLRYDYAKLPSNGDVGIVMYKKTHPASGEMLYYIELDTGRCYLLAEDGIKLHRKRSANESNN